MFKNHLELKPLDIETQSIRSAQKYFTQLDFLPIKSKQIIETDKLVGGRYCSIKGRTAAQLRYTDDLESVSTLYQVDYVESLYGKNS